MFFHFADCLSPFFCVFRSWVSGWTFLDRVAETKGEGNKMLVFFRSFFIWPFFRPNFRILELFSGSFGMLFGRERQRPKRFLPLQRLLNEICTTAWAGAPTLQKPWLMLLDLSRFLESKAISLRSAFNHAIANMLQIDEGSFHVVEKIRLHRNMFLLQYCFESTLL